MLHRLTDTLFRLLPEGEAITREDDKLMALLESIAKEYVTICDKLAEIVSSIPETTGVLYERWQKITHSAHPIEALAAKGFYANGYYLSNTVQHLEAISGATVKSETNKVTFRGLPNYRASFCVGSTINKPLVSMSRPEGLIAAINKVIHAHTIAHYEETINAQN